MKLLRATLLEVTGGLLLAASILLVQGCGGGGLGGDDTETTQYPASTDTTSVTECYFDSNNMNLGEVDSEEGEEAAEEEVAAKGNLYIYNCNGTVNVDQSTDSHDVTESSSSASSL
jgi:hypothetical protein